MNARERLAESDDAVRAELPPELLPVWERVKRTIRETGYASRVECFLDWVHDHSAEVARYQAEAMARAVRKLERLDVPENDRGEPDDALALAFHEAWLAEPEAPSCPVLSHRRAAETHYVYPTVPPF